MPLPETLCHLCSRNITGSIFGGTDEHGQPVWQHAQACCPDCPALGGLFNPTIRHTDDCPRKDRSADECPTCGEPATPDGHIEHRPGTPCVTDYRAI